MKRISLAIVFLLAACASAPADAPYIDDRIDPAMMESVSVDTATEPMIPSTIPEVVDQDASEPQ